MPVGNELNDFASSFTRTLGIISQFPTKEEKAYQAAQTRETGARAGALEFENLPEQRELRRRAAETDITAAEADTALRRQQATGLEFENTPEQRALRTRAAETAINSGIADAGLKGAQADAIRHTLTPDQIDLSNREREATIDNAISAGNLNQAQADAIRAKLTPEAIKLEQDKIAAETGKLGAETRVLGAGAAKQEIENVGKGQIAKGLLERFGFPTDAIDRAIGNVPQEGAIPETPAQEAQPEPETLPGPQTQAIPEGEAAIQQAAYTPPRPPSAGGGGEGNVIEAQSGTRRLPLNDRTRTMLEQASAATGLDVRVTSGAQPSHGPNRTGSHRHDVDVGSGDVQLIDRQTGKPVSMSTPEGQQRIVEFMRAARDAGATGFGAAPDYMGDTTIHVGFGEPGVWGAGGKGANAPDWLKAGLGGGVGARPSTTAGTPSRPAAISQVYQGLQQRDMPQMQAAILAGNIQQESSGNPNSVNAKEGAEGIIQWRQDRLGKLKAFANEEGKNYRDLDVQLDFLVEEGENRGSGQDKAAWQEFMSATTPEAANAALKKFIRYGDQSEGTRLEYAQNLLGGGAAREPVGGISAKGGINRQEIVTSGTSAAKQALKNIYQVGMRLEPPQGGPGMGAPAGGAGGVGITGALGAGAGAAIPDQQVMRGTLTGAGKADPQALSNAQTAVQLALPEGVKITEAERNLMTLGFAYEWALNFDQDPEKAALYARQILQSYRAKTNEYMAIAKQLADNGRLTDAAKMSAKAFAYIPNGQEAKFKANKDGTFNITTIDMATGKEVSRQVATPDQVYAGIMKWSPVDFDRQLMAAAGEAVPSKPFEQTMGQLSQGIPEVTSQGNVPQPTPLPPQPNLTGMSNEEAGRVQTAYQEQVRQIEQQNQALAPPEGEARANVREEIENMPDNVPPETLTVLTDTYGNRLNNMMAGILQTNPNIVIEGVANDLATALTSEQRFANGLPYEVSQGDYQGTQKLRIGEGEYNVPSNVAATIINGINAAVGGKGAAMGADIMSRLPKFGRNIRQGAGAVRAEGALRQKEQEYLRNRPTDFRYRPSALPLR